MTTTSCESVPRLSLLNKKQLIVVGLLEQSDRARLAWERLNGQQVRASLCPQT